MKSEGPLRTGSALLLGLALSLPLWGQNTSQDPALGQPAAVNQRDVLRSALLTRLVDLPSGGLTEDPALSAQSQTYAELLARAGRLSHELPPGQTLNRRFSGAEFPPGRWGEVLGSAGEVEALWQAWLKSPTHRSVLLAKGWTRFGLGVVPLGRTFVVVVNFFGP